MKNFLIRTISGLVFIIVFIGSIMAGPYIFTSLCLIFSGIALYEYSKLNPQTFHKWLLRYVFVCSGIIVFILINIIIYEEVILFISVFVFIFILTGFLFVIFRKNIKRLQLSRVFIFGIIYASVPFALLPKFYFKNDLVVQDIELLLGFFAILWSNDIFAYLIGSLFGRVKFFESISPKKTWEGTIGGMIFSLLTAFFISRYTVSFDQINWLVLGIIISIFATFGDLFESALKRRVGIKDSGKIIPGHGGVLDRFDGMIFAVPVVYIYLSIVL